MSKRRWKPETRREIVMRMRAEGKSLRAIGKELGVSHMTIKRDAEAWFAVTLGVTFDPQNVTADVTTEEMKGIRDEANRSRSDPRG